MKYRPEIDGLRAIAVIPVVLFHAGFSSFSGGFVGVDIFFVISGYLITLIILSEIEKGKFSILDFYERRIRRILPALFFVLFVSIALGWIFLLPNDLNQLADSVISVVFFVSNFYFLEQQDYFNTAAELQPLLHTWSLAVEEQFYLIYPILLILIWRYQRKLLPSFLFFLLAISFLLNLILTPEFNSAKFYLLPTRAWELLLGALIAIYLSRSNTSNVPKSLREVFGLLGLGLILFAVVTFDSQTPTPGIYSLIPTLGAASIIYFVGNGTTVAKLLGHKILVGFGLISYSIYLWHQPLFAFSKQNSIDELSTSRILGLIGLVFIISFLSWRFIEKPFRDRKKFHRKTIFSFAGVSSLVLILISVLIPISNESRYSLEQKQLIATTQSSPKRDQCHLPQDVKVLNANACVFFSNSPEIAVIGNSHAVELSYSLASKLKEQNSGIVQYTMSGCHHNYKVSSEGNSICGKWHSKVVAEVIENTQISAVVLSYRNDHYLDQVKYQDSLVQLIKDLQASNKKVFLVLQAPILDAHINRYLNVSGIDNTADISAKEVSVWENYYRASDALIPKLPASTILIDPSTVFCDEKFCYAVRNKKALFFDDHHMSLSGSDLVANLIIKNL